MTLPPGRARLATRLPPTGSVTFANTMGTVRLVFCNALTVELPMSAVGFAAACKAEGVLCNAEGGKNRVRLVTHLDVPHARAGDVIARLKRAAAR